MIRRGAMCGKSRRRGVSLVEVLAALALAAAVAPALNRAWVVSMTTASRASAEVTAATLAQNKLDEIVAAGAQAGGEDSGQFDAPHDAYRWSVERGPWTGDSTLTQIDVTVTWTRRNTEFTSTLRTLVTGEEP